MMTLQEAIDWLQADDITTGRIWSAADRAGVSTKQMVSELRARNIIDDNAVEFVKKMSGKEYETTFRRKEQS